MLVDIQGSRYSLFDPEIASSDLFYDNDKKVMFCAGNLASLAIENFLGSHVCNMYCELLDLPMLGH